MYKNQSVRIANKKNYSQCELGFLDFAMQGTTPKEGVVFLLLYGFGLKLFVTSAQISRRWFTFLAGFGAFQYHGFSRHANNLAKFRHLPQS